MTAEQHANLYEQHEWKHPTQVAGIPWKNPVATASGTFQYAAVRWFYDVSQLGAVTTKGVSPVPWEGNPGIRTAEGPSSNINAVGLQNPGVDHYLEDDLPKLKAINATVIANVAGHCDDDYAEVVSKLDDSPADMLEINVSCPNVSAGGMSVGTDPVALSRLITRLRKLTDKKMIVKLTPNVTDITVPARAAVESGADALSLINTLLGMAIDAERRRPVLARGVGAHGLLLIGTGDWNDAFDRVGAQGRGESVWLTWFFAITARKFAALVGGHAAEQLALAADHCTRAAEGAWDGAWYRRGYYDDGRPLGSEACGECRIDAIAQAFAALDTHADPGRVHTALTSAVEHLFDREHNVVRLFDPPITRRTPETGYVRSYGAGLRENGGQYTHGALWLAMALLRTGRTAEGAEILHAVLPAAHDPARYEGEPYVLAADIAGGDNAGVAGWTWYTGAAGWYLRIAAEDLLGLHLRGGVLYPEPHLPAGWPECTVRWRDGAGLLHTVRLRPDGVTVDNAPYDGGGIGKKRPKPYSQDR